MKTNPPRLDLWPKIESLILEMLVKNTVLKPCLLIILFEKWAQFPILASFLCWVCSITNFLFLIKQVNTHVTLSSTINIHSSNISNKNFSYLLMQLEITYIGVTYDG